MRDGRKWVDPRDYHDDCRWRCEFCGLGAWDKPGLPKGPCPNGVDGWKRYDLKVEKAQEEAERNELAEYRYRRDRYEYLREKYGVDEKEMP